MLKIINDIDKHLKNSLKNLPKYYIDKLKNKPNFDESIIARYGIYKSINILAEINNDGKPVFYLNNFWSISHKENLIFIGTNPKPIGIDIEIYKERGLETLEIHKNNEYLLLGEKNFKNFYTLWTIKESILKLCLSGIDNLDLIEIYSLEKEINIECGIKFCLKFKAKYNNLEIYGYSGYENDSIYSIAFFKDLLTFENTNTK